MIYDNYTDVRGKKAKSLSIAMGIDEESGIAHTGYLVEIRKASDHFRLSAHATTYAKEVLIFNNRSIEVIELDTVAKEARKTIFDSKDGSISRLKAAWSVEANGYQSSYKEIEKLADQGKKVSAEWGKYDTILMKAKVLAL